MQASGVAALMRLGGLVVLLAASDPAGAAPSSSQSRVEDALDNITTLNRPKRDGYATFWDGNKYVQCNRLPDRSLRCEAAGTLMQPSFERVLTPQRVVQLTALGWRLDPAFGNYVQVFPAGETARSIAEKILRVLGEAYDADLPNLGMQTSWVASEPCPPRNGPSQNLAGAVNDAPTMARYALHACRYRPPTEHGPSLPLKTTTELIDFYGTNVTAEVQRLRLNAQRRVFAVFEAGIGYVQCRPEVSPPLIYCEAQSADSWPALAGILTPERIDALHKLGFADPGRGPNYWKSYGMTQADDGAIAHDILTVLHDIYGYQGQPALEVKTEEMN